MQKGQPRYVTVVSRSDVVDGWRERREERGVIIDVGTDRIVTEDLSMPHSPRLANGSRFEGAMRELFDAAFTLDVRAPMCVGLASPELPT